MYLHINFYLYPCIIQYHVLNFLSTIYIYIYIYKCTHVYANDIYINGVKSR